MAINTVPISETNPSGAIIGYSNLISSGSATGDTSGTIAKALTPRTSERWRPTAATVVGTFDLAALADINYIGLAAHALSGETVLFSTSPDDITYTDVDSITFADNKPIMLTFNARNVRYVKVSVTLASANEIGAIYAGMYLQMTQPIYGGHSPAALNADTDYQSNNSESGNFLGRNIIRRGTKASFSWQHLDDIWYRETFLPFVEAAKTNPIFVKWRPDYYSDEVSFGYVDGDIKGSPMGGGHRLLSATMNLKAHSDI